MPYNRPHRPSLAPRVSPTTHSHSHTQQERRNFSVQSVVGFSQLETCAATSGTTGARRADESLSFGKVHDSPLPLCPRCETSRPASYSRLCLWFGCSLPLISSLFLSLLILLNRNHQQSIKKSSLGAIADSFAVKKIIR